MSYAPLSTDHLIQALRILAKNKCTLTGSLESWITQAANQLEELTADRDLYKKKYTAAVDACWFMHTDPAFKSLPLGSELPVAGVMDLKRQRDEYREIAREMRFRNDIYKELFVETGKLLSRYLAHDSTCIGSDTECDCGVNDFKERLESLEKTLQRLEKLELEEVK